MRFRLRRRLPALLRTFESGCATTGGATTVSEDEDVDVDDVEDDVVDVVDDDDDDEDDVELEDDVEDVELDEVSSSSSTAERFLFKLAFEEFAFGLTLPSKIHDGSV